MSHFLPAEWIDFTRGLLSQPESAALQSHLDGKCDDCIKSLSFWRTVSEFLLQDSRYKPANEVVGNIKVAYVVSKPWRWLIQVAQQAKLIFDSFKQPTPAFVRSSTSASRHLVHEAEPFVIDLRLETVRDRVFLIGQVLNSDNPKEVPQGVDILLLDGEDLVASTKANSAGEFELQSERDRDLRLFINIRGHRAIGITLPDK